MSQNTPCQRCKSVGLVRVERIITGTEVTLAYYCGACAHSWQIVTPDPREFVRVTVRPKKDRRQSAENKIP